MGAGWNFCAPQDDLGPWMTSYPGFQKISFTGSSETGRKVFASAAPTLKHLTLELGGNDPGIVLPDADPQAIAENLFRSMFALSGQGVSPSNAFSCTRASIQLLRKHSYPAPTSETRRWV
jgi:acyl-CoA reductase-like NAD-dependent aldehyde dehydrogenase